jgi:serum/glucocorticoid-regulated kinase 2
VATSSNPGDAGATSTVKPGLLIITLHEAKGLTIPAGGRPPSSGSGQVAGSVTSRPGTSGGAHGHSRQLSKIFRTYCVLEFDKTQVVVNANSGIPEAPVFAGNTTQFKFDVSREAELSVGIYMRNPGPRGSSDEDMFLGSCKILPSFEEPVPNAKKQQPARGLCGTEWVPLANTNGGQVKVGVEYRRNQDMPLTMNDFELMTVVGKGSFGKVMQVKYVHIDNDFLRQD